MNIPLYQVDSFADRLFTGNPAAVCPLDTWLDDDLLQGIAAENNLSETAYFVPSGPDYELRWFTPGGEVDLCGHATLASAYVIRAYVEPGATEIRFETRSGSLGARCLGDRITLDFPSRPGVAAEAPPGLVDALCAGTLARPTATFEAPYWMAVFETEEQVLALRPDFRAIASAGVCLIATAPGSNVDFVSRFFAPAFGIDEDPVTGSAHCTLAPYWADRLGKTTLEARQVSARGGALACEVAGERTRITGGAVLYLRGEIMV